MRHFRPVAIAALLTAVAAACSAPSHDAVAKDSATKPGDALAAAVAAALGAHELVTIGSSLKFCQVAEGITDVYPRFGPTSEWDTSAGQGLLESIGGGLVSLHGRPFEYNQRDTVLNAGFLAFTTPEIKDLALNALKHVQITD